MNLIEIIVGYAAAVFCVAATAANFGKRDAFISGFIVAALITCLSILPP